VRTREEFSGQSLHPQIAPDQACLTSKVLLRSASEKELATCWYEYPINPIKLWAEMSQQNYTEPCGIAVTCISV